VIELEQVSHAFEGRTVLRDISLQLREHRIGVIGANGSGKSTLARTVNGLVLPDQGSVRVDGLDVAKNAREVRRRVGFLFADADAQIIMPTVAEDIAGGLRDRGLGAEQAGHRVEEALQRFGLAEHRDHPAHLLSSGQKQLLALAAVLATEPGLLVCDEPTTLLDLRNVRLMRRMLDTLECPFVLLTHHLDMLEGFERVLVMDEGRVVFDGAAAPAVKHYRGLVEAGP
jgi:biotin transport system ATP-binding protein